MLTTFIILLPFIGTTLGSATVFFCKTDLNERLKKSLSALAAGVMTAASIWSLILPSLELSSYHSSKWFPATFGFMIGILFLIFTEKSIIYISKKRNHKSYSKNEFMLFLAVTLHNFPEGMAVGVACAAMIKTVSPVCTAAAISLSVGIALQNIPEGSIISVPAFTGGSSRIKGFTAGTLSGVVEPVSAFITLFFVSKTLALLPFLLSFAAGAMFYVTIEDLIPEATSNNKSGAAALFFTFGFLIMMILDVSF